jgi:hypothetical protein
MLSTPVPLDQICSIPLGSKAPPQRAPGGERPRCGALPPGLISLFWSFTLYMSFVVFGGNFTLQGGATHRTNTHNAHGRGVWRDRCSSGRADGRQREPRRPHQLRALIR